MQLAKAQLVMKTSGRGAALHTYMERLKKECTNYWMNGHRLCESISLSGNHCTHEVCLYFLAIEIHALI